MLTYKKKKRGPKALIEHFYNKVSLKGASIVILILFLLDILFFLLIKTPNFGLAILSSIWSKIIISWLGLALIYFLLTYFIKGKDKLDDNQYKRILVSLAGFRIPFIILYVVSVAIMMIFFPSFLKTMQTAMQNPSAIASSTFIPSLTIANTIGGFLLALFSLFIILYVIVMYYYFIKKILKTKSFWSTILFLIIYAIIGSLFTSLFI